MIERDCLHRLPADLHRLPANIQRLPVKMNCRPLVDSDTAYKNRVQENAASSQRENEASSQEAAAAGNYCEADTYSQRLLCDGLDAHSYSTPDEFRCQHILNALTMAVPPKSDSGLQNVPGTTASRLRYGQPYLRTYPHQWAKNYPAWVTKAGSDWCYTPCV